METTSASSIVGVSRNTRRAMLSTEQTVAAAGAAQGSSLLNHFTTLLMSALAVFAPLHQMMLALLFLVSVDTLTGIWGALALGNKLTSRKLSRTIAKTFVYLTTICVVHIANTYLLSASAFALPLDSLIVAFIALTEVKSIFENLQKIQKQPLLQFLIDKLAADTSHVVDQLEPKEDEAPKAKGKKRVTKRQK